MDSDLCLVHEINIFIGKDYAAPSNLFSNLEGVGNAPLCLLPTANKRQEEEKEDHFRVTDSFSF